MYEKKTNLSPQAVLLPDARLSPCASLSSAFLSSAQFKHHSKARPHTSVQRILALNNLPIQGPPRLLKGCEIFQRTRTIEVVLKRRYLKNAQPLKAVQKRAKRGVQRTWVETHPPPPRRSCYFFLRSYSVKNKKWKATNDLQLRSSLLVPQTNFGENKLTARY